MIVKTIKKRKTIDNDNIDIVDKNNSTLIDGDWVRMYCYDYDDSLKEILTTRIEEITNNVIRFKNGQYIFRSYPFDSKIECLELILDKNEILLAMMEN